MAADGKLRVTRQRRLILEAVSRAGRHPTADEVYAHVRRRMPHISLGTVCRNLETMAARGLVERPEVGGTQKRYNAVTEATSGASDAAAWMMRA